MSYEIPRNTPESQGVPSEVIVDILNDFDKLDYMKSIIIMRHGNIITEAYWKPFDKDMPQALWSLSKSFTSCAVGLAQSEKLLSVNDKLIGFFPEYRSCVTDEKMLKVTLRDLLTMRSGHKDCAFPYARNDKENNWVRGFLSSPLEYEPGTHFAYNTLGTYMLGAVIRRVTGVNVREYLMPRLFEPMGITPGVWECCPAGTNVSGFGLHLTTMDIAKFSLMLLNKGMWNGIRIMPADYLEDAVKPHADNSMNALPDWSCGYGYQFWCSRHGFRGDGACGQYAIMLPVYDMAVAVNSAMSGMDRVLNILWEKLLPVLENQPLAENNGAWSALESRCRTLEILPAEKGNISRMIDCTFALNHNSAGIESGSLVADREGVLLELKTPRGTEVIRAGFGSFRNSRIQFQDSRPHPVAGSAAWKDENTLELSLMHLDGTFKDKWTIGIQNEGIQICWQTVCSLFRPLLPRLSSCGFSGK